MTATSNGSGAVNGHPRAAQAPGVRTWTATLPAHPRAAGLARQAAREALLAWQLTHLEEPVVLLTSELVTNAATHAGAHATALELRLYLGLAELRIEVEDPDPRPPCLRDPEELDETGRGLLLVEAISVGWGASPRPTGKVVWARVAIEPAAKMAADVQHPAALAGM